MGEIHLNIKLTFATHLFLFKGDPFAASCLTNG